MFTDGPLTPLRLETLIDVLRDSSTRAVSRDSLRKVLQPLSLPAVKEASWAMTDLAIQASEELGLLSRSEGSLELTESAKGRRSIRECVLDAFDHKVLSSTDIEWYFALFYSYLLGLGDQATGRTNEQWVDAFRRDVSAGARESNQFNKEKLTGIYRWFDYVGLGWWDLRGDDFLCNPYARMRRTLPAIFDDRRTLDDHVFFDRLARTCPELDGGAVFVQAHPSYDPKAKQATMGVSHALLELHEDQILRLHAYADSGGWSLRLASPSDDGSTLRSDRLAQIEWIEKRKSS